MFKVGDKVKIRKDLESGTCYDGCYFDSDMSKYKGKETEIVSIQGENRYMLKGCGFWCFTREMFEPVESKFRVGDKVVPHSKSIISNLEECRYWKSAMEKGQPYLFVVEVCTEKIAGEFDCYECSDMPDRDGNYYAERDLMLYTETLTTGQMIDALKENPKQAYKSDTVGAKGIVRLKNGIIRWDEGPCMSLSMHNLIATWTLVPPEPPKIFTFTEAVNSGKEIKHKEWTCFYPLEKALSLISESLSHREWINGEWLIKED